MDSVPVNSETSNEDVTIISQAHQDPLIKPIEKNVIHRICSGQVRKLNILIRKRFLIQFV